MTITTKAQLKKALQTKMDAMWQERKDTLDAMQLQKGNPQVALMIEKNRGYMMALEDMATLLYDRGVF